MERILYRMMLILLIASASIAACGPTAAPAPTVDAVGSIAAQMASVMLTQTAAAYAPPPPPSTPTLAATPTPSVEPTETQAGNIITVINRPPCYFGPGPSYPLDSYINTPKKFELKGVGSVPGWFIVVNPYFHTLCWISAEYVQTPVGMDLSAFPVMTPGR